MKSQKYIVLTSEILIVFLILIGCKKNKDAFTAPLLTSNLWSLTTDCKGVQHTDEEYSVLSLNQNGEYVIYEHEWESHGNWKLADNESTLLLNDFKYQINHLTETELELFGVEEQCTLSYSALPTTKVTTIGVSALSKNAATVRGKVRTNISSINVAFEYGFTTNYGNTTKVNSLTGPILTEFETQISDLIPDTLYHYRVKTTNSNKTYYGEDLTFRTFRAEIVSDIDGNEYNTIKIGTQIWTVENLKTTKYRNGDAIPIVSSDDEWKNLTTGACCNYKNDENNVEKVGRLYNWYAVNDKRNLAPVGWRVATDTDWSILINYLGGEKIAGDKLKAINAGGNNSSGFTALMGGNRHFDGPYNYKDSHGFWWCGSNGEKESAWTRSLYYLYGYYKYGDVNRSNSYGYERNGLSIRCVKD